MSDPKSLMLDTESWKRAINPAVRVIGYTASIYFIMYATILLPLWLIKVNNDIYTYAGAIISFATIFAFIISIFKVIDEQNNTKNPLQLI